MTTTPQKLLIVINTLALGGAERLVASQVECLVRMNKQVEVLTLLPRSKPGFYDLPLPAGAMHALDTKGFSLQGMVAIARILRRGNYDAVVTHLFLANTLVRLAALSLRRPPRIITYEHNVYDREKKFRHRLIDRLLARVSRRIVAVSEAVRAYVIRTGIPERKIVVIENGLPADLEKRAGDPIEVRRELGFSETDILIVSSGNVNPQKGYETLLEAAPQVLEAYPNAHFLICGAATNPYARALKERAAGIPAARIHFLGSRLDALSIVGCADAFLMPSLWEGLPMSLLEALALGKRVVVSDIPSMTALIRDGHNGSTFLVGNADDLARVLLNVLGEKGYATAYRTEARDTARPYSIDANVTKLLACISS